MKKKKTKLLALLLAAMLLGGGLSGCGGAPAQSAILPKERVSQEMSSSQESSDKASQPEAASPPADSQGAGDASAGPNSQELELPSSGATHRSTARERIERIRAQKKAALKAKSAASNSSESSKAPASSGASSESSKAPASSSASSRSTVRDRMKQLQEQQKAAGSSSSTASSASSSSKSSASSKASSSSKASASSKAETQDKLRVGPSLEEIAQLIGLKAEVETHRTACVVDVDEGENPYDVTWDYGELYDAFVQQVDWDLLFDGDYYIQTFPGLAHLYHKDKALLLRHFQTVGIHEGRQGCAQFNVAAYQKNCDPKIREAFGDSYECYYFYYAMNQKTQKKVVATGNEKKQLTTKLTAMQRSELENINKYRAEVGVSALEYDAELSALACYRSYIDALEDWDAHDWIQADENQDEIDGMILDVLNANLWGENTVHGYPQTKDYALQNGPFNAWYINYRYSQEHYDAMIADKYHYVGSSNCYVSNYEKENPEHPRAGAVYVQFDVFVPSLTTPTHS